MAITTVLFDLDGTLLPMDQEGFTKAYFGQIAQTLAPLGYEPEKLIGTIWTGTMDMIRNKGLDTNEGVFWKLFTGVYGEEALKDKDHFDAFYHNEFQRVKDVCGYEPKAAELVKKLKDNGLRVVLATNPIFPAVATESRIRWAGLAPEDFELYTTYENCNYCKPNPAYYREILDKLGLVPEECLMVGNDVGDDMVTAAMGMKVFLLTDCLINKDNVDISVYPNGGFAELNQYVDELIRN